MFIVSAVRCHGMRCYSMLCRVQSGWVGFCAVLMVLTGKRRGGTGEGLIRAEEVEKLGDVGRRY